MAFMKDDIMEDDPGVVERDPTGRFARYGDVLEEGSVRTVYKAFDNEKGIEAAWNQVELTDEILGSEDDLARLRKEAEFLRTLKHENVLRCFHYWVDFKKKTFNMITEISTNGNLEAYTKMHTLHSIKPIKKWAIQILKGLDYLHTFNPPVVHTDLKGKNIFINGNDCTVKIGNFKLATAGRVSSTPEFMAPEVYSQDYNQLADIYSFGMCLLKMITKELPYSECENSSEVYQKVTTGTKPDALGKVVDPQLKQFIEKCLAPVSNRPSAIDLLEDPFLASSNSSTSTCDPSEMEFVLLTLESLNRLTRGNRKARMPNRLGELTESIDNEGKHYELTGKKVKDDVLSMELWITEVNLDVDKVAFLVNLRTDTADTVTEAMVREFKMSAADALSIYEIMEKLIEELKHIPKCRLPKEEGEEQEAAQSHSKASKNSRFTYVPVSRRPSNRGQEDQNVKLKRGIKKRLRWLIKLLFHCGNKI